MLVVVYIISAIAGLLAGIAFVRENIKLWALSTTIAILSGIVFIMNVPEFSLLIFFAIASLIFWHVSVLLGNWENFINYLFSYLLFSLIILVFWPAILFPTQLQKCSDTHTTTETIMIMTTFDSGESVYENGCIVYQPQPSSIYHYYYRYEDGTPIEGTIPLSRTTIVYIGTDESPYLIIVTARKCSGYYPDNQHHCLSRADVTYTLYIPEGSIQNVSTKN